jgi:hypothetical protein
MEGGLRVLLWVSHPIDMTKDIIESQVEFLEGDQETPLIIKRFQDIPQDYLDALAEDRKASSGRAGEFHKACSIPAALHEAWLRQGYDCTKEPVKKTLAKLKAEGLDYFIATEKRL